MIGNNSEQSSTGWIQYHLFGEEYVNTFSHCLEQQDYYQLREVNGQFAGAIHSGKKWILFRDHMGLQPLYYYLKGKDFSFSDDIRILCAIEGADLSTNERKLYLSFCGANASSATETEFRYIHCIRPGSWCEFSRAETGWNMTEHIYWQPGQKKIRFQTKREYYKRLRELVTDAVNIRLACSSKPVCAEISGGLDSGVIDILINRSRKNASFVSWSDSYSKTPMQPRDERSIIEDICAQEKCSFCFLPEEKVSFFQECLEKVYPPFVTSNTFRRMAMLAHVSGADTIFSGHGGDEGASHRGHLVELWEKKEYGAYFLQTWMKSKGKKWRLLRALKQAAGGILKELPSRKRGWQNKNLCISGYLSQSFFEKKKGEPFPPLYFQFDPQKYIINGGSRQRIDECAAMTRDYGVQYLFPLLDYRVIDFAVSIPRKLFWHNGKNRFIFREAFKDILPESLYELDYKDIPSMNAHPDETPESYQKKQEEYLAIFRYLDPERWSDYINIESSKELFQKPFSDIGDETSMKQFWLAYNLMKCAMIQNLQDNAGKWVKEHHETPASFVE